jgi:hypothetical protein
MTLGIMHPYFFPYIGYFQLMNAVDQFVIYDNIEFTKKGWINRNRILVNAKDAYVTLPLKKDSDFLDIKERKLAQIWGKEKFKILNRISASYKKSPYFASVYPLVESCILFDEENLFKFILNSLLQIKGFLGIKTPFIISSTIPIDQSLKGERKIIALCKACNADHYINPIGGLSLYRRENFANEGIHLAFHKINDLKYKQYEHDFIPSLSIIDVLMFNALEDINRMLGQYELV